jgi:DNA-binding response OmpR family regulator
MTPRVLVLDNDDSIGELLALALRRASLQPTVVARADEAEAVLRERAAEFLLLDLNLGAGDSGERLAQRWDHEGILPPFLVLTGTPHDERLVELDGVPGFQGVVAKPFSILDLADRVRRGCGGAAEQEAQA